MFGFFNIPSVIYHRADQLATTVDVRGMELPIPVGSFTSSEGLGLDSLVEFSSVVLIH